ncbi:MAG: hypothetical protein R3Y58_08350 [Eubacteriales bacterium]
MRKYKVQSMETEVEQLEKIICNQCGKEIPIENEMVKEGVFTSVCTWGYFSNKDGETHQIDLCEACYDSWVAGFQISIRTEL